MPITVSIVEDDKRLRESLSILIDGTGELKCLSTFRNAEEALRQLPSLKPDVVLMDINLPGMSGIECVRKLKEILPDTRILMLTVAEDSEQIFDSLSAGANGYLLKRTPPAKILESIQEVSRGASPVSGKIVRAMVEYFHKRRRFSPDDEPLSKREREVLDLLAQGYRAKEIAQKLFISTDTVNTHLRNIYSKLQVHSQTEAVIKYLRGRPE